MDADVLLELKFWSEHLRSLNCRPIWGKTVLPSFIVYSDASAVGCAAFISMNDKPVSHKNWDAVEMKQSSTWRELMCVKHALQGFTHFLKGQCVKWYTDNKGVATIVKSGSNKVHLHKLAMEFFSHSKEHDIAIDMEWIPRSDNEVADYLSKIVDFDDCGVKDSCISKRLIPSGAHLLLIALLILSMLRFLGFIHCFFNLGVWVSMR